MKVQDGADIEIERVVIDHCPRCDARSSRAKRFYQHFGSYRTRYNGRLVSRYRCVHCRGTFSPQTFRNNFGQHRPDLNAAVLKLYASGMTQRRMARVLEVHRTTVVRKFLYLAALSRRVHKLRLERWCSSGALQFDEMETFEHTKLKPVSIALLVDAGTNAIVATAAAPMAYKGKLAHLAFRKYGPRIDRTGIAIQKVLDVARRSRTAVHSVTTDDSPKYPRRVRRALPGVIHRAVQRVPPVLAKRRRNVNDPLFTLNTTAAKLRSDLSRLARRTWVTTKKIGRLDQHLDLYIAWHNGYRLPA